MDTTAELETGGEPETRVRRVALTPTRAGVTTTELDSDPELIPAPDTGGEETTLAGEPVDWVPGTEVHVPSGKHARVSANLDALELSQRLSREHRYAREEEQQVLARWSSWGAAPEVFDETDPTFEQERVRLKALVGASEYAAARRTVLNAHYTLPDISQTMWEGLNRLGVSGPVLEPGCGAGTFIGQASAGTQMVGVELDPSTARIASQLYPSAQIRSESFQDTTFSEGAFNAVVGNVPFGQTRLVDPVYNPLNLSLHNYFIAKSLRLCAPGGYVAVITSTHTLDAKTDKARREFARYADMVGAVRFPEGTFRQIAGTDVSMDVLILRRRDPDQDRDAARAAQLINTQEVHLSDGNGALYPVRMSSYFAEHPENVVGRLRAAQDRHGNMTTRVSTDNPEQALERIRARITAVFDAAQASGRDKYEASSELTVTPGLVERDSEQAVVGTLRANPDGTFSKFTKARTWETASLAARRVPETRMLLGVRDAAQAVLKAQTANAPETEQLREQLRERYDEYVSKYGHINRTEAKGKAPNTTAKAPSELPHLRALKGDPALGVLKALEQVNRDTGEITRAAIFSENTAYVGSRVVSASTVEEAVTVDWMTHQSLDRSRIAQIVGRNVESIEPELARVAFTDPLTGQLLPSQVYLSGNVRDKLTVASAWAESNPAFAVNVAALEAVLPTQVEPQDIAVQLGVTFIPAEVYEQFCKETFKRGVQIEKTPEGWSVTGPRSGFPPEVTNRFATQARSPFQLLQAAMNNRAVTVREKDSEGRTYVDRKATLAAREKAAAISAEFRAWILKDPARAQAMAARYNEMFRSHVNADYTQFGQALPLHGVAPKFNPYTYQREAVAKVLNEPTVLLDHVVGAGKTATMTMSAMELRRLGLANKPALVVPNHLVEQVRTEFLDWYPSANVLAAGQGMSAADRAEFIAQAATGDWDAVIIATSVFERIQVDPVFESAYLSEHVMGLREQIGRLRENSGGNRYTVKQAEAQLAKEEERIKALAAGKDETGMYFSDTGVDYLFVDEAHEFKNLKRISDTPELASTGSNRGTDMDMKLTQLREMKEERARDAGVWHEQWLPQVATFATGTPVANTISELWVMQHYLRPDLLASRAVENVNEWGLTFTQKNTVIRPSPAGNGYQAVEKITRYQNVPELVAITRQFTSVVTKDDLEQSVPELAGGARQMLTRVPSADALKYIDSLETRAKNLTRDSDDNMLAITHEGRSLALDQRLVGLPAEADNGRGAQVADQVITIWEQTKDRTYRTREGGVSERPGSLQILFADQATPNSEGRFSIYTDIKEQLVARGMNPEQIAFIHDAKKDRDRAALFEKCRDGRVNVLIGSTQKMGTGMNVQDRAVALHHIDCPWRPADVEQREGRVIRQGNQNEQVQIFTYATERTFDVYVWDLITKKAHFINQLRNSKDGERLVQDELGELELSAGEAVAALSGNPDLLRLNELEADLSRLSSLRSAWMDEQSHARTQARQLEASIPRLEESLGVLAAAVDAYTPPEQNTFSINGTTTVDRVEAAAALRDRLYPIVQAALKTSAPSGTKQFLGHLNGLPLSATPEMQDVRVTFDTMPGVEVLLPGSSVTTDASGMHLGMISRIENALEAAETTMTSERERLAQDRASLTGFQEALGTPFAQQTEYEQVRAEVAELRDRMASADETAEKRHVHADDLIMLHGREGVSVFERGVKPGDMVFHEPYGRRPVTYHVESVDSTGGHGHVLDADGEPQGEQVEIPVHSARVIARDFEQLSKHEQNLVDAAANGNRVLGQGEPIPDQAHISGVFALPEGEQYLEGRATTSQGTLTITDGHGHSYQCGSAMMRSRVLVHGQTQAEYQQAQATQKGVTLTDFTAGDTLTVDVPDLGYVGDVYVQSNRRAASGRFTDPNTWEQRPVTHTEYDRETVAYDPGRYLDREEMDILYGASKGKITQEQLRHGDLVDKGELRTGTRDGEIVQIGASENVHDQNTVTYTPIRGSGFDGTAKLRLESPVHLVGRKAGALTLDERVKLAVPEEARNVQLNTTIAGISEKVRRGGTAQAWVAFHHEGELVQGRAADMRRVDDTTHVDMATGNKAGETLILSRYTTGTAVPIKYEPDAPIRLDAQAQRPGEKTPHVWEPSNTRPGPTPKAQTRPEHTVQQTPPVQRERGTGLER